MPPGEAEGELAVNHHAQALAHLAHRVGTLGDRRQPRTPGLRLRPMYEVAHALGQVLELRDLRNPRCHTVSELTVEHEAQALAKQAHRLEALLGDGAPHGPAARELAVEEEEHRTRHWIVVLLGSVGRGVTDGHEAAAKLAIHHEAHALPQLAKELGALPDHLLPRARGRRQFAVKHEAQAHAQ